MSSIKYILIAFLILFLQSTASAAVVPFLYSGPNSGGGNIGNGSIYTFDLTASSSGSILDLNVAVDLGGSCQRDIDILITHLGHTESLYLNNSTCGQVNTLFDDEAVSTIPSSGDLPSPVQPVGLLSAFDSMDLAGVWTLTLDDNSCCIGEFTTLEAWSISGTYSSVSAVPLPAAVWLFGSAILGFAGFSRLKKKT